MPYKSTLLRRRIATRTWVEGGSDTIDLDRGYDLEAVTVRVSGTVTLSTGGTALRDLAPSQLVNRMELFSDGTKTHEETNGALACFANFERGGRRSLVQPGIGIATHPVDITMRLDRATMDGKRPKDSSLHTSPGYMSLLQLRLNYGTIASMFTAAAVASGSALTVEVFQHETEERTKRDATEGRMLRIQSLQELTVAASNSNFEVNLPTGNFLRGVKLIALDEDLQPDDTIINNVKFKRGVDVRWDTPWVPLQNDNADDYKIPEASRVAGIAYLDLTPDGRLNRLYDLRNAASAKLILDVTKPAGGNGTIYAGVVEYVEQRGAR